MTRFAEVTVFPHRVPITKRVPVAYTYAIPDEWPLIEAGQLVLAPFGRQDDFDRLVSGVVVRVLDHGPDGILVKPLEALLHSTPVVSPLIGNGPVVVRHLRRAVEQLRAPLRATRPIHPF